MKLKTYAVVGCGRVGSALARFLAGAGYEPVGFASRSLSAARRAAAAAGSGAPASVQPWEVTAKADIVLITTPDGLITGVADKIAGYDGFKKDAVVLHCSGALPSTALAAAEVCGAHTGSMHPLQSFAAEYIEENPFSGIMMAVEGHPEAVKAGRQIAEKLGATPFEIETGRKTLYHAAAVTASNYLVTLMHQAFQLIIASGVPASQAYTILKPLVRGTLSNIEKNGIPRALTGPVARGDTGTVRQHIAEIGQKVPTRLDFYRQLGRHTIEIALAKGDLSEPAAAELLEIFGGPDT